MVKKSSNKGAITSASYSRFRDSTLTLASSIAARTSRALWFIEAISLSARFQQMLATSEWGTQSVGRINRIELWEKSAVPLLSDAPWATFEFGVANGLATAWWARSGITFASWDGFDTFEGLPEAWSRGGVDVMVAGVFTPDAGVGATPNVTAPYPFHWHKGLIGDTLAGVARPDLPLFILVDVDLYEPTVSVLEWLRSNGRAGDVVYFDEGFDPWNEGLALKEARERGLRFHAVAHTGSALLIVIEEG